MTSDDSTSGDDRAESSSRQEAQPDARQPPDNEGPHLRPLTFAEQVALEAYKKAVGDTVSTADKALETVLTASISISTAYIALVGLVNPKNTQANLVVALPFALLLVAAGLSMWGRIPTIPLDPQRTTEGVEGTLGRVVNGKRMAAQRAVLMLILAIAVGGYVVWNTYGTGRAASPPITSVRSSTTSPPSTQSP